MALVKHKPTSPGRRHKISIVHKGLHKGGPYRPLVVSQKSTAGRNNAGRITVRHRGGGHKHKYRIIDFKRNKLDIPAKVIRLEYDPNRNALIALLCYADGEYTYIVAPNKLAVDDTIISTDTGDIEISPGNSMPLRKMPLGSIIHCVELKPKKGAQMIRSAGTSAQLIAKEREYATLRLRSSEIRKVLLDCRATLGEVSNSEHSLERLGKAGANRWRGIRPTVRGVVMNPVDHPHGGGEGKTSGGRHPVSPWGMPTKGYKTRKNKRTTQYIVRKRSSKK